MTILETDRLTISHLNINDAPFILQLVNTEEWLKYIGDRNVHNIDDAVNYISNGPVKSYEQHGFGLSLVQLKNDNTPIGICGLIKRDSLEHVDIGFAFLPEHSGMGYAYEAAFATLKYGLDKLGLNRIVAITVPYNHRSIKLLEKIGMSFERTIESPDDEDLMLFAIEKQ